MCGCVSVWERLHLRARAERLEKRGGKGKALQRPGTCMGWIDTCMRAGVMDA